MSIRNSTIQKRDDFVEKQAIACVRL